MSKLNRDAIESNADKDLTELIEEDENIEETLKETLEKVEDSEPSDYAFTEADINKLISEGMNDSSLLSKAFDKFTQNPETLNDLENTLEEMPDNITNAVKTAANKQGANKMAELMKQKGFSSKKMKKQIKQQKKALNQTKKGQIVGSENNIVIINASKKILDRKVYLNDLKYNAHSLIKTNDEDAEEMFAYKLKVGPLQTKDIYVWYDPKNPTKNKVASRLLEFDVGGCILIYNRGGDVYAWEVRKVLDILTQK